MRRPGTDTRRTGRRSWTRAPTERATTHCWRQPLFRCSRSNLVIGIAIAGLMLGGLLAINPGRLRD